MIPNAKSFPESRWIYRFIFNVLKKGRAIAASGWVRDLQWHQDIETVTAQVQEPTRPAFTVEITLQKTGRWWSFEEDTCSCPKSTGCTHAAAVLVAITQGALNQTETSKSPTHILPAELRAWLLEIRRVATPNPNPDLQAGAIDRILYLLQPPSPDLPISNGPWIKPVRCRKRKDGTYGKPTDYNLLRHVDGSSNSFVQPADIEVARRLQFLTSNPKALLHGRIQIAGSHAIETLRALVATGRCHWVSCGRPPLRLGDPRPAPPPWHRNSAGPRKATFALQPPAEHLLSFNPPWYIDAAASECGPIQAPFESALAQTWLLAPVLDPLDAATHSPTLLDHFQPLSLPTPETVPVKRPSPTKPVPALRLSTEKIPWWEAPWSFQQAGGDHRLVLSAHLSFWYGENHIAECQAGSEIRAFDGKELTLVPKDAGFEAAASNRLRALGLVRAKQAYRTSSNARFLDSWTLENGSDEAQIAFITTAIPKLRSDGWRIERDGDFALEICEPSEWYFETAPDPSDAQQNWFDVELGVRIGDDKVNLLPILLEGLRRNLGSLQAESLDRLDATDPVLIQLPDGRRIPFPAGRLREILSALIELHSPDALARDGRLRVHRIRAAQLSEFSDDPSWNWAGADTLRDLSSRLASLDRTPNPPPPAGLRTTLRHYQADGLRWLQFIREFGLGGILADDMGLGKTIQAIAHLLVEKESGRLDRPALIVSPTSVLVNWQDELARFSPDLRVLTLHGGDRHTRFGEIQAAEVVLTTYPLLSRDSEELLKADFHCILLDEAQNIKNPRTQAAQVVCQLKARHRLCLSGTPIENHLGELWSLFNFLIPGFLSDETRFRAVFRQPIEKYNDKARRKFLSRRVRPFLLRRRKDEVARELPEKTEIDRKVDLVGSQRDLYETSRVALESRGREEIQNKGVSRSHIIILDALLKLRQVCCDPRLVPLEAARGVTESAKLDLLMELVPTLLEDGRRILLFSQFTSMLALIAERLDQTQIPFLLLTGDTTDRATPVRRFQSEEVPLFLISLKAGGSGLNLTAADTVILFDPWWNPAVEAQATDRAHRIGQDKPVFVYRLLTTGTVEEKMAALQARKRELVQALLEEGSSGSLQLQKEDLDALFAPIG